MLGPQPVGLSKNPVRLYRLNSDIPVKPEDLILTSFGHEQMLRWGPARHEGGAVEDACFSVPSSSAWDDLRAFARRPIPAGPADPSSVGSFRPFKAGLDKTLELTPQDPAWVYRPRHLMALPEVLSATINHLARATVEEQHREDYLAHRRRTTGRRVRDGASASAVSGERPSAAQLSLAAAQATRYGRDALMALLPVLVEELRLLDQDRAEWVADCQAQAEALLAVADDASAVPLDHHKLLLQITRIVRRVLVDLMRPPTLESPPPSLVHGGREAAVKNVDDRLKWTISSLYAFGNHASNCCLFRDRAWFDDAMRSIEGTLRDMAAHDCAGRDAPRPELERLSAARRACQAVPRPDKPDAAHETALLAALHEWSKAAAALAAWVAADRSVAPHFGEPLPVAAPQDVEPGAGAPVRRSRTPPAAGAVSAVPGGPSSPPGQPHASLAGTPVSPTRPRPTLTVSTAVPPSDPARTGAGRTADTEPFGNVQRLLDAPAASPSEARDALKGFVGHGRLRDMMAKMPRDWARLVIARLETLVRMCGSQPPGLTFFLQRELLDAAWTAEDAARGEALAGAVLTHFGRGPLTGESPAGFRSACLAGQMEKLFRALPSVPPAVALAALQALERRLALQETEDRQSADGETWPLSRELADAVAARRLGYMARYSMSLEKRMASAGDMHAWLASALFAISDHASDAGVASLARRLGGLCGMKHRVPAQIDRKSLREAAFAVVTAEEGASCQHDAKRRRVSINAHNLHTPLFAALLAHFSSLRTEADTPAVQVYELLIGGQHRGDGAPASSRKQKVVEDFLDGQPEPWRMQTQGGPEYIVHDGRHPRNNWSTVRRAAPVPPTPAADPPEPAGATPPAS